MSGKRKTNRWREEDRGYSTPCWIWQLAVTGSGYGHSWDGLRQTPAHRVVYAEMRGPIPAGLQLDHLCGIRTCVNPSHLEPVTPHENNRRSNSPSAVNARKTHCPKGHPLSGENLHVDSLGKRSCRQCRRATARRWKARNPRRLPV